jgi:penicillin-binding protein 2
VFDYWLLGHYPSEEDMAATQKGQTASPIGKPRNKAEVPLIAPKILPAGKADKP